MPVHLPACSPRWFARTTFALSASAILSLLSAPAARAGVQTWTGSGPRAKSVYGLARDPLNASRLWAASFGAGIYTTTNGGTTWTVSRTGLLNTFARCVTVNPHHPDSLFCGTNDGIYGSTDGGTTWAELLATPCVASYPRGRGSACAWRPVCCAPAVFASMTATAST